MNEYTVDKLKSEKILVLNLVICTTNMYVSLIRNFNILRTESCKM